MLKLYTDTKIYILAPAYVATWWVELLHQLAFKIEKVLWFKNVFIKYLWIKENKNPTSKDYEKYEIKSIQDIEDFEHTEGFWNYISTEWVDSFKRQIGGTTLCRYIKQCW